MTKNSATTAPREQLLGSNELIISKTDSKGLVTYANRTFMKISGYREDEILGQPHNFIRHQDMPRGCFKLLWQTIASGDEFFAYVINRCKNGDYYWVLANVTPDYTAKGNLIGYYSVRRHAPRNGIDKVIPIYREMCAIEQRYAKDQPMTRSINYLQQHLEKLGLSYQEFILNLHQGATK